MALATLWRLPQTSIHESVVEDVLSVLGTTTDPGLRLQAVRLVVMALGDYQLEHPAVEIDTGYSTRHSLQGHAAVTARIGDSVRRFFPSGDRRLDEESVRLLAMLRDADPGVPAKVAAFWTKESDPTSDLHFLICYSRLTGTVGGGDLTPHLAEAILALDRKLQGREHRTKQTCRLDTINIQNNHVLTMLLP